MSALELKKSKSWVSKAHVLFQNKAQHEKIVGENCWTAVDQLVVALC